MKNPFEQTYCNPLSLPDYMTMTKDGAFSECFYPTTGRWQEGNEAWFEIFPRDYRSESDPDIIFYEGKWYLYGGMDRCYSSADMLHWETHLLDVDCLDASTVTSNGKPLSGSARKVYEDLSALTAAVWNGKIYMMHNGSNILYVSDSPTGPFRGIGAMKRPDGSAFWCPDPALFADDDGRLYLYFGCGPETGIQGVELDGNDPTRLLSEPTRIVEFRPESGWECTGARYQETDLGWIEGADLFKYNGRYYLIYAANGTVYDTYNMGVYYSDEGPLTGFKLQQDAPFCEKLRGICRGSGHGCVTEGSNGSLWVFYTALVGSTHMYERRIGMDKVTVNGSGELTVVTTDEPQWAPGVVDAREGNNAAGIRPLTFGNSAFATSAKDGRTPMYATDESMTTWWMPDEGDNKRQLVVIFRSMYDVYASRVLWKEEGIDTENGIFPGAIGYTVEITDDLESGRWQTVLDLRENKADLLNDYRATMPARGCAARLTITDTPSGLDIGVISFTVFGKKA